MNITDIRNISGLDKAKFARKYNIPYRTLQDWESGKNKPPAYVELLLEKVVRYEFKEKD
jgi:putative transcriptional regulator